MSISFPLRSPVTSSGLRLKLGEASIQDIKNAFEARFVPTPLSRLKLPPEARVTDTSMLPASAKAHLAKLDEALRGNPAEAYALKLGGYPVAITFKEERQSNMQFATLFASSGQELATGISGEVGGFRWVKA
jgi:hypothetical protein